MKRDNQTSGKDRSGTAAAPAREHATLDQSFAQAGTPEQYGVDLSKLFGVHPGEVALLRLEGGLLRFLCPSELCTAGSIPISSSSAVAAHTVMTKKIELFNNFTRVKHASIFESVKAAKEKAGGDEFRPSTIHKLMSAPVLDNPEKVLGVVQVCRKGFDLASAGPDFTLDDLQQLEVAAKALSKCAFMRVTS